MVNVLISNAKVSDKMTYVNSADPDQTGAVWIRVYTVCHSTNYLGKGEKKYKI